MDAGWFIESIFNEDEDTPWNAIGTNMLVKFRIDYNETQMWSNPCYCEDCFYAGPFDTQMTLVEVCDLNGDRGSVTIAARRLKRVRCANSIAARQTERKCNEAVSARTERAIDTFHRHGAEIRADGEREQQEIFETQMMRLGENDELVEDWRDDFETWLTFAEQIRSFPRYNRHQRSW